eukprot:313908-Rhodomonas_salina.1
MPRLHSIHPVALSPKTPTPDASYLPLPPPAPSSSSSNSALFARICGGSGVCCWSALGGDGEAGDGLEAARLKAA